MELFVQEMTEDATVISETVAPQAVIRCSLSKWKNSRLCPEECGFESHTRSNNLLLKKGCVLAGQLMLIKCELHTKGPIWAEECRLVRRRADCRSLGIEKI